MPALHPGSKLRPRRWQTNFPVRTNMRRISVPNVRLGQFRFQRKELLERISMWASVLRALAEVFLEPSVTVGWHAMRRMTLGRLLSTALVPLSVLAGCSSVGASVPPTDATDDARDQVVEDAPDSDSSVDGPRDDDEEAQPDEDLMASMSARRLSDDELAGLRRFGIFNYGVEVVVGDKEGVTWRIFALDQVSGTDSSWTRKAYLTDASDTSDDEGTWIELRLSSSDPWRNVDWSGEMLVRGVTALELAKNTLTELHQP